MNIKRKFLIILLVMNLFTFIVYLNSFAVRAEDDEKETDGITLDSMETDASGFIEKGASAAKKDGKTDKVTSSVTKNFKGLGQILTMVGAGVMVAVTSYMGIKYIVSPPDKQAALKQQLIGLVAAGIVIFGAYGIWKAIINVVKNF